MVKMNKERKFDGIWDAKNVGTIITSIITTIIAIPFIPIIIGLLYIFSRNIFCFT